MVLATLLLVFAGVRGTDKSTDEDKAIDRNATKMVEDGRQTFRFDTFGDEDFWGGQLRLHEAIAGATFGGTGPGLTPKTALALGLKVDSEAIPALKEAIKHGKVDLDDPGVTLSLLRLDAVVGVKATFTNAFGLDNVGKIQSIGITCALCHSTVDDSITAGVGKRLDGYANRDLDVGQIVAFAPTVKPIADLLGISEAAVRGALLAWGPGKFDAELILDGKATRPDGKTAATLIPPAFGLAGVNLHTWTGWGSVTHWNAFVSNLEMHGKGTFFDPRLKDAAKFPIAAKAGFDNVRVTPDKITSKLAALHFYQLAIPAPTPADGTFDAVAAARGKTLFTGKATCSTCHVPPLFTEPGWNMHTPSEVGVDDFQAKRSPDERYRTSPLKGLFTHTKGGFYHDGRFATLRDVIDHYVAVLSITLTEGEKLDLVEYLKSI